MIDELIEKAKQISHNKQGSNSVCFCFGDYILLYGSIDRNNIDRKINIINSYIERGFNIAPTLEYKYDENSKISTYANGDSYQKGWTMQSRAKGKELERNVSDMLYISSLDKFNEQYLAIKEAKQKYIDLLTAQTDIDEVHLRKFITDYQTILEEGILQVDPSKASNFFYDANKGFTFIDIGINQPPYEKSNQYSYLPKHIFWNVFPQLPPLNIRESGVTNTDSVFLTIPLTEEEFEVIHRIQQKLGNTILQIFLDLGWDEETIKEVMDDKFISRDKEDIYPDEQTLYKALADKFSRIVANNRANGQISNQSAGKNVEDDFTIET